MNNKFFPISTATGCKLKWIWSTIHLNAGLTSSCHRTAWSELTSEDFDSFHNTPIKISDRKSMLQGEWPEKSCGYCREIEHVGGTSDRLRHLSLPYDMPHELMADPASTHVSPTLLEVYFNNTCNLGCLYCLPSLSSRIADENRRFGKFEQQGVLLENPEMQFKSLVEKFWQWFPENFPKLSRLNVAGGEPLYQNELDHLLEMIDAYPNPDCELNIVTNLMVSKHRAEQLLDKFEALRKNNKIKRVDITCSIDCWGAEQEYVRWGLNVNQWAENLLLLLNYPHIYVNINQTISLLTIKTMPELLTRLAEWRQLHQIGHWFSEVTPGPEYLKPHILGGEIFAEDFEKILTIMPRDTAENIMAHDYMLGIANRIGQQRPNPEQIRDLFVFLGEKDRRRSTDWKITFPWLESFQQYVV